jgi:hypothetical protein
MLIRKWGLLGTFLGAAVFAGCEESATEQVQEKQEDVIEAQQNLREQEAELNEAKQEAQQEAVEDGRAPHATETTITKPAVPPVTDSSASDATEPAEGPTLAPLPGPSDDRDLESNEQPNEGNPEAGTAASTPGGTEAANDQTGSADEGTPAEAPEPATPQ